MTDLSPAAQAVLDAYRSSHLSINNLAAALRAAADQIEKQMELPNVDGSKYAGMWHSVDHLMRLAEELEGNIE